MRVKCEFRKKEKAATARTIPVVWTLVNMFSFLVVPRAVGETYDCSVAADPFNFHRLRALSSVGLFLQQACGASRNPNYLQDRTYTFNRSMTVRTCSGNVRTEYGGGVISSTHVCCWWHHVACWMAFLPMPAAYDPIVAPSAQPGPRRGFSLVVGPCRLNGLCAKERIRAAARDGVEFRKDSTSPPSIFSGGDHTGERLAHIVHRFS